MPGQMPNGLNTLIPLFEASGHLQIKYSRNPKSMRLNKYTRQTAAPLARGAYLEFNPNDNARLLSSHKWPLGTPASAGFENQQGFQQKNFVCERYAYATTLDKFSVDIGNFDVQKVHTEKLARQAMMKRTAVALAKITDTAQYPAANVVTATSLASGFLDAGTTSDPRIFKALTKAAQLIQVATAGAAGQAGAKFGVLMSVNTALRLSYSREIREYVMQNPESLKLVTGENETFMDSASYMLPNKLYKFETVVEDSYVNTGNPDSALDVNTSQMPDNVLIVYVVDGGFSKEYMEGDFSTFTQFVYEDMTVESKTDDWDRMVYLRVVDFFDVQVTSPKSGVVITAVYA